MRQRKSWAYALGAVMMLVTTMFLAGCGTSKVDVSAVQMKDMPVRISSDANVAALNKATIQPTASGTVAEYKVKVGDVVAPGQVVATLDTSALQSQLANLQNQLASAATATVSAPTTQTVAASVSSEQVEQARQMRDAGIITVKEYNVILSRSQASTVTVPGTATASAANTAGIEAAISQVQNQIAQANIVSPIAGTVSVIYNEDRKVAVAERPFMVIQQDSPVVASLSIPAGFASKLAEPDSKPSTKVYLKVDKDEIPGEITYIDTNAAASGTPSVLLKATFNNPNGAIKPGEFYTLVIESEATAPVLTVAKEAVHENKDGKYVYVVTADNTVDVRVVETGDTVDGYTTIISGLSEGEQVITSKGNYELGEKVKINN